MTGGHRLGGIGALTLFTIALSLTERNSSAAEPEVAELGYERPAELSTCPDETTFRAAVTKRLGRDPFVLGAPRKINVSLTQSGPTLTAVVRVEEAGQARGERRIETRAGCEELASGAALAVSIAIDPLAALGPANPADDAQPEVAPSAPPPPPTPKPVSAPPPLTPAATPPPIPAPARGSEGVEARAFARLGVRGWAGIVPKPSVGPSLGFGYQRGHWSLALDGLAVLAQRQSVPETSRAVSVGLVGAQLSPCAHWAALRGCALFASGALLARGVGVDEPRTGASWYAAAGLGVGYSLSIGRFFVTPNLEVSARVATAQLSLDDNVVWTTPRWVGSLGLEFGYDFWR